MLMRILPNRIQNFLSGILSEVMCYICEWERMFAVRRRVSLLMLHSGGDLVRPESFELSVVPAVPGRLLRFKGDLLHAVPCPTDLWLLPFVKGAPQFEPF
jgi:hypothetical protein